LISIGPGSVIEPGCTLIGPCLLGNGCVVRQGAYLRGNILASNHVVIGHASEVKNSIFLSHAKAAHFAYVGDSILGNGVNLGAGTKCANLRFDNKEVKVRQRDRVWKTGLRKLGAILGDGAQTGCNSVTSPGTIIEKNGVVAPCSHVKGWVG
jgi:UDP-N-acetylglucosamine diphosphorylase / glucose-1-phosphate thymidylyltransferase / UDP-N-acetylgalactosamine diphosphorylase / glucosamine-1-phosphate N-acetyltransferase / galactosamine-1-phosphate N-acetyltransferase